MVVEGLDPGRRVGGDAIGAGKVVDTDRLAREVPAFEQSPLTAQSTQLGGLVLHLPQISDILGIEEHGGFGKIRGDDRGQRHEGVPDGSHRIVV